MYSHKLSSCSEHVKQSLNSAVRRIYLGRKSSSNNIHFTLGLFLASTTENILIYVLELDYTA